MGTGLPEHIERVDVPGGVRYFLPPRPSGSVRAGGFLILIVVSVVLISIVRWIALNGVPDYQAAIFFTILLLMPIWLGRIGLDIVLGRFEIELRHNLLVWTKRIGPWRQQRSRSTEHFAGQGIGADNRLQSPGKEPTGTLAGLKSQRSGGGFRFGRSVW